MRPFPLDLDERRRGCYSDEFFSGFGGGGGVAVDPSAASAAVTALPAPAYTPSGELPGPSIPSADVSVPTTPPSQVGAPDLATVGPSGLDVSGLNFGAPSATDLGVRAPAGGPGTPPVSLSDNVRSAAPVAAAALQATPVSAGLGMGEVNDPNLKPTPPTPPGGGRPSLGVDTKLDTTGVSGGLDRGPTAFNPNLDTSSPAGAGGGAGGGTPTKPAWQTALDALGAGAKLGVAGLGVASGIENMRTGSGQLELLKKQQREQQRIAAPAAAAGSELTSAGALAALGGALPPGLEQQVQNFINQSILKVRQFFAAQGESDSTMEKDQEAQIQKQAVVLREQLAQQLLQSGYEGINTALGPSGAVTDTASRLVGASMGSAQASQAAINRLAASA